MLYVMMLKIETLIHDFQSRDPSEIILICWFEAEETTVVPFNIVLCEWKVKKKTAFIWNRNIL